MAVIVPGKFAYFALPRTASVATEHMLLGIGTRLGGITKDTWQTPNHHVMPWEMGVNFNIPIITTIRNPLEILRTWCVHHSKMSLAEMLEADHNNLLTRNHKIFWNRPEDATIVLRFETIEEDWEHLLRFFNLPPRILPVVNETKKIKPAFSHEELQLIDYSFGNEMDRWGYV